MRFLLTFLALSILSQAKAQEFAPIGATWTFNSYNWNPPNFTGWDNYVSEKDTIINSISCKKIIGSGFLCSIRPKQEFLHKNNDSVFFWDEYFDKFQLLYDINAQAGDSWSIEISDIYSAVDSIVFKAISSEIKTYNSREFRTLNVEYSINGNADYKINTTIYEGISEIELLIRIGEEVGFQSLCDGEGLNWLHCYTEPSTHYVFPTADACLVSTNEISKSESITIYPNPTKNFISINAQANKLEVINISGETLFEDKNSNQVNVESLTQGIYYLKITLQNGDIQFKRFLKN